MFDQIWNKLCFGFGFCFDYWLSFMCVLSLFEMKKFEMKKLFSFPLGNGKGKWVFLFKMKKKGKNGFQFKLFSINWKESHWKESHWKESQRHLALWKGEFSLGKEIEMKRRKKKLKYENKKWKKEFPERKWRFEEQLNSIQKKKNRNRNRRIWKKNWNKRIGKKGVNKWNVYVK